MPHQLITTKATSRLADPVTFTLAGLKSDRTPWSEDFEASPALTMRAVELYGEAQARAAQPGYEGSVSDIAILRPIMEELLLPESFERLEAILDDRTFLVDVEDVFAAMTYCMESTQARPTSGRPSSPRGSSSTPSTSAASSSSPAIPRLPSLPSPAPTTSTSRSRSSSTASRSTSTAAPSSTASKRSSSERRSPRATPKKATGRRR